MSVLMPNFHALTLDRAAIDLLLVCDYIVSTRQGIIMKIDIIKIGNSRGIRLPKAVIEQCGFAEHVELEVRGDEVVLRPAKRKPREGWEATLPAAGHCPPLNQEELAFLDSADDFDETEWTWPESDRSK